MTTSLRVGLSSGRLHMEVAVSRGEGRRRSHNTVVGMVHTVYANHGLLL